MGSGGLGVEVDVGGGQGCRSLKGTSTVTHRGSRQDPTRAELCRSYVNDNFRYHSMYKFQFGEQPGHLL